MHAIKDSLVKKQDPSGKITADYIKEIAKRFWQFLNTNSAETFLDADVRDVAKAVVKFLNQDIIGQKIIILGDKGKLDETASSVAIFLKRQRYLRKTKAQKEAIAQVKTLYRYFNHPFWRRSKIVGKTRLYMKNHLRRMTPSILKGLNETKEKLELYFDMEKSWDNSIVDSDLKLQKDAMNCGFKLYAICQMHQEPIALDKKDVVFCSFADCTTKKCPFESNVALGAEAVFLAYLHELLEKMGTWQYQGRKL